MGERDRAWAACQPQVRALRRCRDDAAATAAAAADTAAAVSSASSASLNAKAQR